MHKIIQITDPHLSRPGQVLWGLDPFERLQAAFKEILTFHSDAEACFITGDHTDSASPEALLWLKDTLAAFPISTHLMIGNHDVRSVFLMYLKPIQEMKMGFYNIHSNWWISSLFVWTQKKTSRCQLANIVKSVCIGLTASWVKLARVYEFLCITHHSKWVSLIWTVSS